jgi:hypothetical protein
MNKKIDYLEEARTQVKLANESDIQADYYDEQGEPENAAPHRRITAYHTNQAKMLALVAIAEELRKMNVNLGAIGPQQ